jgi:hypothetical protein
MHKEILTKEQVALLPLVKSFSRDFGLVGGTAIAFCIGHRRSIDFDLFTLKEFDIFAIRKKIAVLGGIERVLADREGEYTIVMRGVRLTFFHYPFKISFSQKFNSIINMPDLVTLAAMKAYALGRRVRWKDYVDLYFVMRDYHGIEQIVKRAQKIFGKEFNEKMFRAQLAYFEDIDYSEKIIYMKGFETPDSRVRRDLINFSLS